MSVTVNLGDGTVTIVTSEGEVTIPFESWEQLRGARSPCGEDQ